MGGPRVVGIVPARLSSTRFPRKVLALLAGRPLVVHAHERLSRAASVDEAVIATDSAEVEAAARLHGAAVVVVKGSFATGTDRVAAAVQGREADVVVNLQADQPLIDPHDIDRVIGRVAAEGDLDVVTLAYGASDPEGYHDPNVVKAVVDGRGRALYFSRAPVPASRDAAGRKPLYLHHVGIYCFRRAALERFAALPRSELEERESLEQLRALSAGMSIGVVVTDHETPGIDTPRDLEAAEGRATAP
jgi:3-deoxy-manno-octulosonate cytidylyltransferase (CMP-KDO synthetase)